MKRVAANRGTTRPASLLAMLLALAACAGKPAAPDWQMNAHDALERSIQAYLAGDARVEAQEFSKARSEIARTGRVDVLARAELRHCAARVASLVFEPCEGFEKLRADSPRAEQAYAEWLRGATLAPDDLALLPPAQRAVALPSASLDATAAALRGIDDPLSRLVAIGTLLQAGRADPQALSMAVDTASQQGWRRPLLAWLGVQAERAERSGQAEEAARLRRRMDLAQGGK